MHNDDITCFHLNYRSLISEFTGIQVLFKTLSFKFDIITFSETWVSILKIHNFFTNSAWILTVY